MHLGLGEVPIPRVDGLELAAVDRNARLTIQDGGTAIAPWETGRSVETATGRAAPRAFF
jgi:hypothetical protein